MSILFSLKDPPLAQMGLTKGASSAATIITMGHNVASTLASSLTSAIDQGVVENTQESIVLKVAPTPTNDFSPQDVHVTPINVDRLEQELSDHPDPTFASTLCGQLRFGAHIGYKGPRIARFSRNLPTALANPTIVTANLEAEVKLGRVAGPFAEPPFPNLQVSPLGIVPKKHSEKFRTIFHLSYPKSGVSINSCIDKEEFSLTYVTIDNAIQSIQSLGRGTLMCKTDIESAFRLFPVHPDDYDLLGMQWDGSYYFDKVLPFGLRSAPFLFNQLSDSIEWILKEKCAITYVTHFLDDFLIMEPPSHNKNGDPSQAGMASLNSMLLTFKQLQVPISHPKTQGPLTRLEFLGIVLDSEKMEACLPHDKVSRMQEELDKWQTKKFATLKELQSLIGTLNFACRVVPPGRPFLQRIINLTIGVKKPHHHIRLTKEFFADLDMWKLFVRDWNGHQFFLGQCWDTSASLSLYTDASGTLGFGGIYGTQWFQGKWVESQLLSAPGISINWQELYAIVVACSIWGPTWSTRRVLFYCDNSAVVYIINTKRSKCSRIMSLLRSLTLATLKFNFYIKAKHVPGASNEIADSLSRFQVSRFRHLAPWADVNPQPLPPDCLVL